MAMRFFNLLNSRVLSNRFSAGYKRSFSFKTPKYVKFERKVPTVIEQGGSQRFGTSNQSVEDKKRMWLIGGSLTGLFGVTYYYSHLENVPISNRTRFMTVSPQEEQEMSRMSYNQIITQYRTRLVPHYHPYYKMVERVADRIVKVAGLGHMDWEVNVIADESEVNAFVLPGGKIFVFTGILKVTENDDQLAAILGHEIAHQIARHAAEKLSFYKLLFWLKFLAAMLIGDSASFLFNPLLLQLGVQLPFSRKCEIEADYIGLLLMSNACYDPRQSIQFWKRMTEVGKGQGAQFLSTHPSHQTRITKLNEWMRDAVIKYENSDCSSYVRELEGMFSFPMSRW